MLLAILSPLSLSLSPPLSLSLSLSLSLPLPLPLSFSLSLSLSLWLSRSLSLNLSRSLSLSLWELLRAFVVVCSLPLMSNGYSGTAACVTAAVTFASRVIVAFDRCERLGRCMNMGITCSQMCQCLGLGVLTAFWSPSSPFGFQS